MEAPAGDELPKGLKTGQGPGCRAGKREEGDLERNGVEAGWLARAADSRANLVRIAAIACFYAVHLLNVFLPAWGWKELAGGLGLGQHPVPPMAHLCVSVIVFAWLAQAAAVHAALAIGCIPERAALAVVLGDVLWLSAVLGCSTGPAGPMVAGYSLIVVLAGLRLNLWLVRWGTVAAVAGYLGVLGAARWPVGVLQQLDIDTVPRWHQMMTLLAIVFTGTAVGQTVRLAWGVVAVRTRSRNDGE